MRKFVSLMLVIVFCISLSPMVFAVNNRSDYDQLAQVSSVTRIENIGSSVVYSYQDESITYNSQISPDGTMLLTILKASTILLWKI